MRARSAFVVLAISVLSNAIAEPIYVIDGDTFILGTEHVRIANIDAPEISTRIAQVKGSSACRPAMP